MARRAIIILALMLSLTRPAGAAGEAASLKAQEAAAAMVRGNTAQALVLYTEALADTTLANDRRATILNDRGVAHIRLGQTKLAFDDFNQAVQLFPEYAAVYNNRGNLLLALGVVKEAVKDFDRALVLAPGYASAYNNRAGAQLQLGDYASALRDYTKAVQLMPQSAAPLSGRGRAHLAQGRPHAAIRDFSRAVHVDVRFATAYRNRGEAKLDIGHYEEAIEDFSRAIAFDVANASLYRLRAHAYLALGNTPSAIKDFSQAIETEPGKAAAHAGRGLAHAMASSFEEAFADLNRAIELEPRSAQAFAYRAIAYKLSQRADIGRADVETAAKLDADDADVLWARAEIAEAEGRREAAIENLHKALVVRPSFKQVTDALDRLGASLGDGGDAEVAGLGLGRWRVVSRSGRYFAVNGDYKKLRVPLEMIGEGQPKIVAFELKEAPLKGIAVLTFFGGSVPGTSGPEETELAAILDLSSNTVVAVQPHRQGDKVANWSWSEGKVTVASVDGVTDELVLRTVKHEAESGSRRRYSSADEGDQAWTDPWAGPRSQGGRPSAQRRRKPKSIFDLIFGF